MTTQDRGEMPELAEGARLEIVCAGRPVPRVRIPLSPPSFLRCKNDGEISPKANRLLGDPPIFIEGKNSGEISPFAEGGEADPPTCSVYQ